MKTEVAKEAEVNQRDAALSSVEAMRLEVLQKVTEIVAKQDPGLCLAFRLLNLFDEVAFEDTVEVAEPIQKAHGWNKARPGEARISDIVSRSEQRSLQGSEVLTYVCPGCHVKAVLSADVPFPYCSDCCVPLVEIKEGQTLQDFLDHQAAFMRMAGKPKSDVAELIRLAAGKGLPEGPIPGRLPGQNLCTCPMCPENDKQFDPTWDEAKGQFFCCSEHEQIYMEERFKKLIACEPCRCLDYDEEALLALLDRSLIPGNETTRTFASTALRILYDDALPVMAWLSYHKTQMVDLTQRERELYVAQLLTHRTALRNLNARTKKSRREKKAS